MFQVSGLRTFAKERFNTRLIQSIISDHPINLQTSPLRYKLQSTSNDPPPHGSCVKTKKHPRASGVNSRQHLNAFYRAPSPSSLLEKPEFSISYPVVKEQETLGISLAV